MAEDFILKNVSESLIDMYLDECLKNSNVCSCERCRTDIKAYALNQFPQHYVVTDFGDALVRVGILSNQFKVDVITAIMNGIVVVKKNPRHNINEDINK